MSRRALWAPKRLDSWNWREAFAEEQPSKRLPFEAWQRPDHSRSATPQGGTENPPGIEPSLLFAWMGFTVAGLAAMMLVLSTIYGQLVSALTGVAASPGLPILVLAVSVGSGLLLGAVGVVLGRRKRPRAITSSQLDEPDNSIAA